MAEHRLRAVVQVVMEVEADSVWGSDTTWEQIVRQAENEVREMLVSGNKHQLEELPRRIKSLQMVEVKIRKESDPR